MSLGISNYQDMNKTILALKIALDVDLQAKLIHCLHRILIRFTQPLWA